MRFVGSLVNKKAGEMQSPFGHIPGRIECLLKQGLHCAFRRADQKTVSGGAGLFAWIHDAAVTQLPGEPSQLKRQQGWENQDQLPHGLFLGVFIDHGCATLSSAASMLLVGSTTGRPCGCHGHALSAMRAHGRSGLICSQTNAPSVSCSNLAHQSAWATPSPRATWSMRPRVRPSRSATRERPPALAQAASKVVLYWSLDMGVCCISGVTPQ